MRFFCNCELAHLSYLLTSPSSVITFRNTCHYTFAFAFAFASSTGRVLIARQYSHLPCLALPCLPLPRTPALATLDTLATLHSTTDAPSLVRVVRVPTAMGCGVHRHFRPTESTLFHFFPFFPFFQLFAFSFPATRSTFFLSIPPFGPKVRCPFPVAR